MWNKQKRVLGDSNGKLCIRLSGLKESSLLLPLSYFAPQYIVTNSNAK